MVTPMPDNSNASIPTSDPVQSNIHHHSSEDETLQGDSPEDRDNNSRAPRKEIDTDLAENNSRNRSRTTLSHIAEAEKNQHIDDDLEILKIERVVSKASLQQDSQRKAPKNRSHGEIVDDFDIGSQTIHEKTKLYQSPEYPPTSLGVLFKKIHQSSFLVRWIIYITPITLLLSIPIFISLLVLKDTKVGGLRLFWVGVWLEIIWLSLWLSRIVSKLIPWPTGLVCSLLTNNSKKWKDLAKVLEVPATLLIWVLIIEISFIHIMKKYHLNINRPSVSWERVVNKIIVSALVGAILNFIEKIIIQLIAMNFHLRTYADRIEVNKFQISSLVKLYIFSKQKIALKDSDFELNEKSGIKTPMAYVNIAGKNARQVLTKVGDVAGKVAQDFTGQAIKSSTHPQQVVLQLIRTNDGSRLLARRLYRTFARGENKTVFPDDLSPAFENEEEAQAAFAMFDMDLNGDISMEELEAVCVEIGRERKGITASLKDLDSVVSKLDQVFFFIVVIITLLVFLSLISTSASVMLTSAGSTILALSWLLQATAQECLQSIIFVFVKHPFDVGDRVTIYGNTGKTLTGDDYFVKEISLLYTEFKKMEGHVVQAPNSYLNTVFILNQRRSGGLAEAIPVTVKFGTTLEQIDTLRQRLLEFVTSESREYQQNILTELTTIYEAYSITLNIVFFYKSNWQNELVRLQRRNKFICAMMVTMNELGIEGPRTRLAGASQEFPMYLHGAYPINNDTSIPAQTAGPGPRSGSLARDNILGVNSGVNQSRSSSRRRDEFGGSQRGEPLSVIGRRVDLSLGMSSVDSADLIGDVFTDREPVRIPSSSANPLHEENVNVARTQSRNSDCSSKFHRRFSLRRKNKLTIADDGSRIDDLEAGSTEFVMPNIIEAKSENQSPLKNNTAIN